MLTIQCTTCDELTPEELEEQPDNGDGKENANYLIITIDGKRRMILSDAMEPEDATFTRDLSDVKDAIRIAYEAGLREGRAERP